MSDERERAERIVNRILSIYPLGIVGNGEPRERLICAIADSLGQTAREEQARGLEEVIKLCKEHQEKGAVAQNHWYLLKLKNQLEKRIKMLREEGGSDE